MLQEMAAYQVLQLLHQISKARCDKRVISRFCFLPGGWWAGTVMIVLILIRARAVLWAIGPGAGALADTSPGSASGHCRFLRPPFVTGADESPLHNQSMRVRRPDSQSKKKFLMISCCLQLLPVPLFMETGVHCWSMTRGSWIHECIVVSKMDSVPGKSNYVHSTWLIVSRVLHCIYCCHCRISGFVGKWD